MDDALGALLDVALVFTLLACWSLMCQDLMLSCNCSPTFLTIPANIWRQVPASVMKQGEQQKIIFNLHEDNDLLCLHHRCHCGWWLTTKFVSNYADYARSCLVIGHVMTILSSDWSIDNETVFWLAGAALLLLLPILNPRVILFLCGWERKSNKS